ncbi:glycosyltransferase family 2 protein [Bacillus sp. C11]|nr:glycosyltransferase family 2 protein [Neobacillus terrae]
MATYNGSHFIRRQLDSVLKQLDKDDQVIVVDDGSGDGTPELIKETYGNKVEVHINMQNLGVIKSFEKAISLAKGDIIFLCDQDDVWEDIKVERVKKAFIEKEADLVVHDASVVDGDLQVVDPSWNHFNRNNIRQGIPGNILKNAFTGCMMAFKRELLPAILPFPETIEMHDQWIALVCIYRKKKIAFVEEPLMKYVRHGGNVTGMKKRSLAQQLKGRIGTLSALLHSAKG